MLYRRFLASCLLVCGTAALAFAQQSFITPESLRTWLTYLASDELEGRATFSESLGLAGAYIADQLKEAGVSQEPIMGHTSSALRSSESRVPTALQ